MAGQVEATSTPARRGPHPQRRGRAAARFVLPAALAAGLLAAPPAAGAQQAGRVFQIGILSNVPMTQPEGARIWGAFVQGLRDLGYVEGQNIAIVHRSTEGRYERLPELAAELVRLKVDVIVAPATQNVRVAMQATRTIPIVMAGSGDPVRDGLVASLARPGGNVTGLSLLGTEMAGKQLALLREIAPQSARVAVLGNPTIEGYRRWLGAVKSAAPSLGAQLQILEVRGPDDLERAFAAMTRERAGALFVLADGMTLLHRARVVELAGKHRLPAMYGTREFADAGGLVFYGASMRDSFRRAAAYVDRILRGASPGDLPVEQPTTFELVVNLKAARGLGLTIPPAVLARADEVLQ